MKKAFHIVGTQLVTTVDRKMVCAYCPCRAYATCNECGKPLCRREVKNAGGDFCRDHRPVDEQAQVA